MMVLVLVAKCEVKKSFTPRCFPTRCDFALHFDLLPNQFNRVEIFASEFRRSFCVEWFACIAVHHEERGIGRVAVKSRPRTLPMYPSAKAHCVGRMSFRHGQNFHFCYVHQCQKIRLNLLGLHDFFSGTLNDDPLPYQF